MRFKFTIFCTNKKLYFFLSNVAIFILFSQFIFGQQPTYRMSIEEIGIMNSGVEASVYIENLEEAFEVTSYQCALSLNQNIDLSSLSLSYIVGSSELLNKPTLYVGIDNVDGPAELTFVSFIGNDIISKKTRVGTFLLEGSVDLSTVELLDIQWDFEGTISTIITGKDFMNITDPKNHISIFPLNLSALPISKVEIFKSEASSVTEGKYYPEYLFDGKTSRDFISGHSNDKSSRWAVSGFPQWVTIDLGEKTTIDYIKLDPFASEKGVSYDCEFYTGNYENKVLISAETTQTGSQWSEHSFKRVKTRYITLVVTGSEGNDWCDFWEMEVYGNNSTTGIEDQELTEDLTIPHEYGMSQNYPNPFNPTTKIEVRMKENGSARLDIYNILGERVLAILDEELNAGVHEVNIDGSDLASGIYFYKLDIENRFSQIKKMNLIK